MNFPLPTSKPYGSSADGFPKSVGGCRKLFCLTSLLKT